MLRIVIHFIIGLALLGLGGLVMWDINAMEAGLMRPAEMLTQYGIMGADRIAMLSSGGVEVAYGLLMLASLWLFLTILYAVVRGATARGVQMAWKRMRA